MKSLMSCPERSGGGRSAAQRTVRRCERPTTSPSLLAGSSVRCLPGTVASATHVTDSTATKQLELEGSSGADTLQCKPGLPFAAPANLICARAEEQPACKGATVCPVRLRVHLIRQAVSFRPDMGELQSTPPPAHGCACTAGPRPHSDGGARLRGRLEMACRLCVSLATHKRWVTRELDPLSVIRRALQGEIS